MNNNDAIIARIKGLPAQPGTKESEADPNNPNVNKLRISDFPDECHSRHVTRVQ